MKLETIGALSLLGSFPEPALVIDAAGDIRYGNPAAGTLLGVDGFRGGESITTYMPEDERSRLRPLEWLKRWADVPDAPEIRHVHLVCRSQDGTRIPTRVRVGRLETEPPHYVVLLQDIRDEQTRIQQTREAHRLAARMLAISMDAVLAVDASFKVIHANVAAERLFGYPSGGLLNKPLNLLLPERFRMAHQPAIDRFAAEPAPARLMGERAEIVGLTRSGEEVPLEASIAKITTANGFVFTAQVRDLRPRKAAEATLRETLASLRTVFENALQAMALLTPDGRVREMNAAARQLLPLDTPFAGEAFSALPFWSASPDDREGFLRQALAAAAAGRVYRGDVSVRLPDGAEHTLDFSLTPVMEGGDVRAIIAEARDLLRGDA
ncbi:MAG: PAS domain S-box protein [Pseudomonadales bacterium]|nr:PAS domain S-box protein [Pseudomonadales bacterium]